MSEQEWWLREPWAKKCSVPDCDCNGRGFDFDMPALVAEARRMALEEAIDLEAGYQNNTSITVQMTANQLVSRLQSLLTSKE